MVNNMYFKENNKRLEVIFEGEIDHRTTLQYREKLISKIDSKDFSEVILNFEKVSFIDSSGIGMVLGRFNQMKLRNGKLYFSGLSDSTYRLFELSGLLQLIPQKEAINNG